MLLYFPLVTALALLLAVLLDQYLGEPTHGHPIVVLGRWINAVENRLRREPGGDSKNRQRGILAVVVLLGATMVPALIIQCWLSGITWLHVLVSAGALYVCIAPRSLREHAEAVILPLAAGDLKLAREKLSSIVSRDTAELSETQIATATCESVLENGSDAIFAAIFWFLLFGIPGVLAYRVANTLDAMWGYRTERYSHFGWAAAKLDDLMNWVPARWVAFSYALMGDFKTAISCWSSQASTWKSPNAGPVMAAGAGSLGIIIGGEAIYHGERQMRPVLGAGRVAGTGDIVRALALIKRTLLLWMVTVFLLVYAMIRS